ncbi:MAG: helix-turn-helix transcriptional regulator [Janthinobacterium lividum]
MNTSSTHQTRAFTAHTIQRLQAVLAERGISRSQHYFDIKNGLWVPPVKLGIKASGWPTGETSQLNAARIAGKTPDEIRILVTKLMVARAAMA